MMISRLFSWLFNNQKKVEEAIEMDIEKEEEYKYEPLKLETRISYKGVRIANTGSDDICLGAKGYSPEVMLKYVNRYSGREYEEYSSCNSLFIDDLSNWKHRNYAPANYLTSVIVHCCMELDKTMELDDTEESCKIYIDALHKAVEDYYRKEFNIPDDFHGSIDYNVTSEYNRYP